jgi:hypothetical protein
MPFITIQDSSNVSWMRVNDCLRRFSSRRAPFERKKNLDETHLGVVVVLNSHQSLDYTWLDL